MVNYDRSTALIVVDVQNDFADPRAASTSARASGSCRWSTARLSGRWQPRPWSPTPRIGIPPRRHTSNRAAASGPSIASSTPGAPSYTQTSRSPARWSARGRGGEDGYSGFTVRDPVTGEEAATPLEELLRRRGVGRVVVVGLATDYCVKETTLDAVRLGFDTAVLGDLVRAVDLQPGDGERALAAMRAAGARIEQPA